jgi:hypothetical protein
MDWGGIFGRFLRDIRSVEMPKRPVNAGNKASFEGRIDPSRTMIPNAPEYDITMMENIIFFAFFSKKIM